MGEIGVCVSGGGGGGTVRALAWPCRHSILLKATREEGDAWCPRRGADPRMRAGWVRVRA